MSTQRKTAKKMIAAISGLALMSLSAMFNDAAAQAIPPGAPTTTTPATQPATPAVPALPAPLTAMDTQLVTQIDTLARMIEGGYEKDTSYRPGTDTAAQTAVDGIIATLRAGANGNLFMGQDGQKFMGYAGMSAFATAIPLAVHTGRLDMIEEFIAAGANPKQVAPDKYTPMDYAIYEFMTGQFMDRDLATHAFAVIQRLEAAGVKTADAKNVQGPPGSNGQPITLMIADYNGLVKSMLGHAVIEEAGGVLKDRLQDLIDGGDAVEADLADEPRLTRAFVENNGGRLVQQKYSEAYPGGPEVYMAQAGDTLASIAMRFHTVMGERSALHGLSTLMQLNDIDANAPLRRGQTILIPKPPEVQIVTPAAPREMTVREMLTEIEAERIFYIPNTPMDDIIRAIAQLNGMNPDDAVADKIMLKRGSTLVMAHRNDLYDFLPRLTPPPSADPARRVDLVVIEGGGAGGDDGGHQKRTFGSAASANWAINPQVDFSRFFAWEENFMGWPGMQGQMSDESNALRALLAAENNPLRDNLIFTQSMEISVGKPGIFPKPKSSYIDEVRQQNVPNGTDIEAMRRALDILERTEPIIFTAAGNQYANGEGPYKQAFATSHGPRTYIIGAAGKYNVFVDGKLTPAYVISHYSTGGADMCAPLPPFLDEQQEGTSFSTPLHAGLFRQENEWFGNILTPEEMMAAAMMTADRNVMDYLSPTTIGALPFDLMYSAQMAKFDTNGGGLPYHQRCGAGVLDIQKWHDALLRMVELKMAPGTNVSEFSETIAIGDAVTTPSEDGKGQYVYQVTVPQDMTMGKLTMLLPQYPGQHSDVTLRSPSGFELLMPRGIFQTLSTHALAYEDVKAGQVIEIITDKPLAPGAEMILRGHTGVNPVALLRDELRANGTLPAPLTTIGGQAASGPLPIAPTKVTVGDTIATPEAMTEKTEEEEAAPPAEGAPQEPRRESPRLQ